MGHARDPTGDMADLQAVERSWATVAAHLEALGSTGDCGAGLTDDVTLTIMETAEVIHGRAAVAALLTYVHRSAFSAPPVVMTLIAGAERAMIEAEFAGHHLGEFAGILPTGRVVHVPYVVAYDLDADTIRAMRLYLPMDKLVRQLREI